MSSHASSAEQAQRLPRHLLWALVVLGWAVLLATLGIVLHGWRR